MSMTRIPMGLHNTFREVESVHAVYANNQNPKVAPFMALLITALLKRRPRWEFISRGHPRDEYYHFTVQEDGVELGTIGQTSICRDYTRIDQYEYSNARIRGRRARKSAVTTKDLAKAVKGIIEDFYKPTVPELIRDTRNEASTIGRGQYNLAASVEHKKESEYVNGLRNYAMRHPDRLPDDLRAMQEGYAKQVDERVELARFTSWGDTKDKALVVIDDGTYHVESITDSDRVYTAYPEGAVPRTIMQNVALLKLVEDKQVVTGVGIRIHSGAFAVVVRDDTEELT